MKYWVWFIVAVLGIVAILRNLSLPADLPTAPTTNEIKWHREIQKRASEVGFNNAYAEFGLIAEKAAIEERHGLAHIFGEVLAEEMGERGITVCDDSFELGCFHGFFIRIISLKGIGVMPELEKSCREKNTGSSPDLCFHGIGHGLGEFFGPERIDEALEICGKISPTTTLGGCGSGVFMEYYGLDNSATRDTIPLKAFDPLSPYEPCPGVAEFFRASCYFEIGKWWMRSSLDFKEMDKLCDTLKKDQEREYCYRGIGAAAAQTGPLAFNTQEIIKRCGVIESAIGKNLCISGAISIFDSHEWAKSKKDSLIREWTK